jgi:hypothetical protein
MIKAALQTSYLRACLNTTRPYTAKKFNMSATKSFVTSVTVPKVKKCYAWFPTHPLFIQPY